MKYLFFTTLFMFSVLSYAQVHHLGYAKQQIITDYKTNYPQWIFADGYTPKGKYFISYTRPENKMGKSNSDCLKFVYFFNESMICEQSAAGYLMEFLIGSISTLNKECIKVEDMKWINKKGDMIYTIKTDELFFWLYFSPLD